MAKKKFTIEFIKSEFAKEGYKLLATEYENIYQKLPYECPRGHKHSVRWNDWYHAKSRCPFCAGKARKTIEFIKSEFAKEDYILLTTKYINSRQKLIYICPKGHKHSICWSKWQQGRRCPHCAGLIKKTVEFIGLEFRKKGHILLTTEYVNSRQKLECICPNNHRYFINWHDWNNGIGCSKCMAMEMSIRMSGSNNPNWKDYSRKELQKLSNYKAYVLRLTRQVYKKYKPIINPLNLPRRYDKYHLDHIYSIINGFENSVSPEIITCPFNLRMLKAVNNLSKNGKSDISLEELYDRYNDWEEEKCSTI